MTPAPPPVSAWTDLGGGVRVRQSRAFMMNSGLLLDRGHAVAIDPGVLPSELDELAAAAREAGAAATSLYLTHAHWDHVLGRPWWPDAEVIAHDHFAAEVARDEPKILAEAVKLAAEHGETWTRGFKHFRPRYPVSGMHYATRGPWHLVFRDAFGHCGSQLTLHLPPQRLLFAADMLSDVEIPWLDREPAAYRATLETLLQLAENGAVETLVPGHGSIAHGADAVLTRLHEDLEYLEAIEHHAAAAVRDGHDLGATLAALEAMEYRGKTGGPFPMADVHRGNVTHAWQAAKTPKRVVPATKPGKRAKPGR